MNVREINRALGNVLWCLPNKSSLLFFLGISVSNSTAFRVDFEVRTLQPSSDPFIGHGVTRLNKETFESVSSLDGY